MHIIQWDVNGLRSRLPELDILRRRYSPAAICLQETHLRPTHTASLRGYALYRYDHLAGERANGGTPSLCETVYILARSSYKARFKL
jgi:exonuclease III